MAFGHKIRDLIFNSREDNRVCLLGTIGTDSPNISPKGSMMIFDDDHFGLLGAREAIGAEESRGRPPAGDSSFDSYSVLTEAGR